MKKKNKWKGKRYPADHEMICSCAHIHIIEIQIAFAPLDSFSRPICMRCFLSLVDIGIYIENMKSDDSRILYGLMKWGASVSNTMLLS